MAIMYRRRGSAAGGAGDCCDDGGAPCADCAGGRQLAPVLAGLEELAGHRGRRGRALRRLGQAHRGGQLAGLGDIDMSSFVISQGAIDAESAAFDGRLNAWLFDYASAAASLPPAFVQLVDDFVARWRKQKDAFYFFQTSRLSDLVKAEAEYNRLRDQFLSYGKATAVPAATVTANGATVRADQIPPESNFTDKAATALKWGAVLVGGLVALKVANEVGVVTRLMGKARA